jgi:hypothetical protein
MAEVLIILAALGLADARLYEAAAALRASPPRIFWTVTLPGARSGLISATFAVFTTAITDFGAPKVIGGQYNVARAPHAGLTPPLVSTRRPRAPPIMCAVSRPFVRTPVLNRGTAIVVALCLSLGVAPVCAEEPPAVRLPDAQETPFVLLPDKELASPHGESARMDRDWVGLGRDTVFLLGYQIIFVGILYALPESVSRWSDDQKKNASFEGWWDNVRHPVSFDKDNPLGNYVGHPYIGAAYYTRARERGFGEFDSFLYSALASAMFELGPEAVFERPSYQDLIVTPVGGALLGFAWEPLRNWIKRKPERQWYDHLGLFVTDPIGSLNGVFERLLGIKSDVRVDVGRDARFRVELRLRLN